MSFFRRHIYWQKNEIHPHYKQCRPQQTEQHHMNSLYENVNYEYEKIFIFPQPCNRKQKNILFSKCLILSLFFVEKYCSSSIKQFEVENNMCVFILGGGKIRRWHVHKHWTLINYFLYFFRALKNSNFALILFYSISEAYCIEESWIERCDGLDSIN